jgi:SRSO17 transposase
MAADVPFSWVAEDAVYGVGDVEGTLRRACKSYVLGVKSDHYFGSWSGKPPVAGTAQEIARDLDPSASQRLSAGEGTKGARLHDWAYCELADLDADEYTETKSGLWARGLLIRRNTSDGDLAFITTWCLDGTGIQTLVSVKGHRRAIEDSFETAKNELGPDHNETRSCHGWHHHASLVMLAFAIMAVIRCRTNDVTPPQKDCGCRPSGFDPLVNPGSPAHRHQTRPASYTPRLRHRMVMLETRSSGGRATSASEH